MFVLFSWFSSCLCCEVDIVLLGLLVCWRCFVCFAVLTLLCFVWFVLLCLFCVCFGDFAFVRSVFLFDSYA